MTTKNYEKVIEVLAEKVASLELDLSFTKYERDELKRENKALTEAIKILKKECANNETV